jgi:hypothetical protein
MALCYYHKYAAGDREIKPLLSRAAPKMCNLEALIVDNHVLKRKTIFVEIFNLFFTTRFCKDMAQQIYIEHQMLQPVLKWCNSKHGR